MHACIEERLYLAVCCFSSKITRKIKFVRGQKMVDQPNKVFLDYQSNWSTKNFVIAFQNLYIVSQRDNGVMAVKVIQLVEEMMLACAVSTHNAGPY